MAPLRSVLRFSASVARHAGTSRRLRMAPLRSTSTNNASTSTSSTTAASARRTRQAVGIDLGTTQSVVAVLEGREPRVLEDEDGYGTTPSVVAYLADGRHVVGRVAQAQAAVNPDHTFAATKRLIGRRYDEPEVAVARTQCSYDVVPAANGEAWLRPPDGTAVSPVEVREINEGTGEEDRSAVEVTSYNSLFRFSVSARKSESERKSWEQRRREKKHGRRKEDGHNSSRCCRSRTPREVSCAL